MAPQTISPDKLDPNEGNHSPPAVVIGMVLFNSRKWFMHELSIFWYILGFDKYCAVFVYIWRASQGIIFCSHHLHSDSAESLDYVIMYIFIMHNVYNFTCIYIPCVYNMFIVYIIHMFFRYMMSAFFFICRLVTLETLFQRWSTQVIWIFVFWLQTSPPRPRRRVHRSDLRWVSWSKTKNVE